MNKQIYTDIETAITVFCSNNNLKIKEKEINKQKRVIKMEVVKDLSVYLKINFEIKSSHIILTRELFKAKANNHNQLTSPSINESRLNIPLSSFNQQGLEEILETFWVGSTGGDSQVYYSTSYIVNKDRVASMISNKSDTNYCLNIGSMCFDWSPDDNLYVYSDPRLSKVIIFGESN